MTRPVDPDRTDDAAEVTPRPRNLEPNELGYRRRLPVRWLGPALRMLSVLVPGQLRGFPVAQLPSAKTWVAAGVDERGAPHAR